MPQIRAVISGASVNFRPRRKASKKRGGSWILNFTSVRRPLLIRTVIAPSPSTRALPRNLSMIKNEIAANQNSVLADLDPSDFRVKYRYRAVPALAGSVTRAGLARLAANPLVVKIDLDVGGTGSLGGSVPLISADNQHSSGVTGEGVVVAVLDTGIDTDHDDLADDLIHQECFLDFDGARNGSGRCPNGSDRQSGPGAADDGAGH